MSPTEQAFLAAILASPDDDLPRLVYADWLDENEQPDRAEFIRVQCELARLSPGEPRQAELAKRADALERAHNTPWVMPAYVATGGDVSAVKLRFSRGFVSEMEGSLGNLARCFGGVTQVCPIERLTVVEDRRQLHTDWDTDVGQVTSNPAYARIRGLHLSRIETRLANQLLTADHATGLRELRLDIGFDEWTAAALAGRLRTQLREFRGWLPWLPRLPNRESGAILTDCFNWRGEWPNLEHMRFDNCYLGHTGTVALSHALAPRLKSLYIYDNDITLQTVQTLLTNPRLQELSLSIGGPTADFLREPADDWANLPPGSRRLRLTGWGFVGTPLVEWLVANVPPGRFDHLEVSHSRIGRTGALLLSRWEGLKGVKVLDVRGNEIGDAGAGDLARSPHLDDVRLVLAATNLIAKPGKEALRKRFGRRVRVS